jgi:hypothetical protein
LEYEAQSLAFQSLRIVDQGLGVSGEGKNHDLDVFRFRDVR